MNSYLALFLVLCVTCAACGSPTEVKQLNSLFRQRRDTSSPDTGFTSILGSSSYGKLVEELIENLRKAAQQARDAVTTFNAGLQEEAAKCQERFLENMEKLKGRINDAMNSLSDRFSSSGAAVRECINSHNDEAELLLNSTMEQTTACTNQRISEGAELIQSLSTISENAREFTSTAYAEMKACTQNGGNFLAVGSCLGTLALKTEMNGAVFLAQSGISITRLNIYMSTLPAALELCAGSGLVGAGMGTAKIVMEIGSCSAQSVFTNLTGSSSLPTPSLPTPSLPTPSLPSPSLPTPSLPLPSLQSSSTAS